VQAEGQQRYGRNTRRQTDGRSGRAPEMPSLSWRS
jgi:hypothetical protein